MSFVANALAAYHRSGLRGSHRLTGLLADRLDSLQHTPVETENGIVYVDLRIASARAILADPASHTGEVRVIHSFLKPGDTAYDIGAHFGVYTLLISRCVGSDGGVIAFEPNPGILPSLRKTLSNVPNIRLFDYALSNADGTLDFFVPEDASMASFENWTDGSGGRVHKVSCETRRLDDLINAGLPMPDFVKCDVEGAELLIFDGGRIAFDRKDAPVILFEIVRRAAAAFGNAPADYFEMLRSFSDARYEFYEVLPKGMSPLLSTDIEYANVLAVPANRVEECGPLLI